MSKDKNNILKKHFGNRHIQRYSLLDKQGIRERIEETRRRHNTFHHKQYPRPDKMFTPSLDKDVTRLELPEKGSFNAGLAKIPNSTDYVLVYRPDEDRFKACKLNKNFQPYKDSYFELDKSKCADPKIIWTPDNKLLMVYASVDSVALHGEYIAGSIIMDLNESDKFVNREQFRISPADLMTRQKNWMPFVNDGKIYLVASVCPHVIYELNLDTKTCEKVSESSWAHPWFYNEFLRGNTNCVQLEDGNYLGTFHTATWRGAGCWYDNGAYLFSGKAPFNVLKCTNKTYLPAEAAKEKHFRNAGHLICNFPVGMVREGNKIHISYGDNDSVVKILHTTVEEIIDLMLDVY